jgi:hypothetical protein
MENLIEENRMIAEFMEISLNGGAFSIFDEKHISIFRKTTYKKDGLCKWCHNNVTHGHNTSCYVLDDSKLKYHKDWNIMPVAEKCLEKHNNLIDGRDVIDTPYSEVAQALQVVSKKEIYQACIKFIKFYNQI